MPSIKLSRNELLDILGSEDEVLNKVSGNSRWSISHDFVFRLDGKLYRAPYSVGATEQQSQGPWEYAPEPIECVEVREVPVQSVGYEPVQ